MPPITPSELKKAKPSEIPEPVIAVFNELITKHWNGKEATVRLGEVLPLAVKKLNESAEGGTAHTDYKILESGWLDVEDVFAKAGWTVNYEQPHSMDGAAFKAFYRFTVKSGGK